MKKRDTSLDLLRIVACISVVILHEASQNWYGYEAGSIRWYIYDIYDAIFRFGVPIFVMISGALFSGVCMKETFDTKRLLTHNALRLLIVYAVWAVGYGVTDAIFNKTLDPYSLIIEILIGRYHLWFLPMMVGIYLILPVLRPFFKEKNEKLARYLVILFVILKIFRETILALDPDYAWTILTNILQPDLVTTYAGYFFLGYYLYHFKSSKLQCRLIYIGGLCSVILAPACSIYLSNRWNKPVSEIYDSYSLFTFLIAAALFLFFKEHVARHEFTDKGRKVIEAFSADTLGIYLLHVAILEVAARFGLTTNSLPAALSVPVLSLCNLLIGLCLAAILRRLPKVGRYIC